MDVNLPFTLLNVTIVHFKDEKKKLQYKKEVYILKEEEKTR